MSDAVNPSSRRPSARDRTAARLTEAARAQLLEGGEMTVVAVAERAGVSRATAYRYFINNDAVRLWAALPILSDVSASIDEASAEQTRRGAGPAAEVTPLDRADRLVRERGAWAFEHELELRTIIATSLAPDSEAKGLFRQGKMRRGQWIEDSLIRYLPDWVSVALRQRLAAALVPLFGSDMVVWTRDAAELPADQALDVIAWIARSLVQATIAEARAERRAPQTTTEDIRGDP